MTNAWEAEQEVDVPLALSLIKEQFPDLKAEKIQLLGVGWDNTAYLINDAYVFRFPRREIALALLENEHTLLPEIAQHLPVSIPNPKWRGTPSQGYPWPFIGYPLLPGKTACSVSLSELDRIALAEPLAKFVKALHSLPRSFGEKYQLPGDTIRRLSFTRLISEIRKKLDELSLLGIIENTLQFDDVIGSPSDYIASKETTIVHGDLYVRHLLVNENHQLVGIIDWGDVHIGDPAIDLSIVHSFLPQNAIEGFLSVYGPISEDTWRLSLLRALHHSLILTIYGHHVADGNLEK